MSDQSRWVIELVDRVSGPATRAANKLQGVGHAMAWVGGPLGRFGAKLAGAGRGINELFSGRGTLASLTSIGRGIGAVAGPVGMLAGAAVDAGLGFASMAASAASSVAGIGYALGQNIVALAAFRESSLAALEAVTGSAEVAGRSFRNAIVIANQTPGDTQDIAAMSQRYLVAGFSEAETINLLGATADIGAAFGSTKANSLALVLSQMRASDRMDRGDLRQLLNAGVNTGDVLDSLARQLNIQGATERERRSNVLKAITERRVTGNVGIEAAFDAISGRLDRGGALGGFARAQSETLTGALSNAKNAWDNLVLEMDTAHLPGLVAFKDAVLEVTHGFEAARPAGRAVRNILSDITEIVGVGLFGRFDAQGIDDVGTMLEEMRPTIRAITEGIVAFGEGLGDGFLHEVLPVLREFMAAGADGESQAEMWHRLGQTFGEMAGTFVRWSLELAVFTAETNELLRAIEARWTQFSEFMGGIPNAIVGGLVGGLLGGLPRVYGALRNLAELLPGAVEEPLEIHSPSRRMFRVGGHIADGLELGIAEGSGRVGRAMGDLAAPPTGGALGALGGGRSGVAVGDIYVTVQAREGEAPEALGGRIARSALVEIVDLLGILNAGPAPEPA